MLGPAYATCAQPTLINKNIVFVNIPFIGIFAIALRESHTERISYVLSGEEEW